VLINTPSGDGGMNWGMKNPINGLNKVFDNRIRLGVMSVLMVNEEVNFNDLKQMLEVTDGNLATHLVNLEDNGYIKVHKGFIGRKQIQPMQLPRQAKKLSPIILLHWKT
jgi:DNA-binding MarR family transcriptional regulator